MPAESDARRQFVNFAFFKVSPEWRRLDDARRSEHRREFAQLIRKWRESEEMIILAYSLSGKRSDADFMLWRVCYSLECLQQFHADLMATQLGAFLQMTHSYLAMTRQSQYKIGHHGAGSSLRCGGAKYATVTAFSKTRNWYQLPFEERQRIVSDYIRVIEAYPRVRLHTLYSFGLDDQEFILTLESDHLSDVVDMKMELRESENSPYTAQDTPTYTCVQADPERMLELLG